MLFSSGVKNIEKEIEIARSTGQPLEPLMKKQKQINTFHKLGRINLFLIILFFIVGLIGLNMENNLAWVGIFGFLACGVVTLIAMVVIYFKDLGSYFDLFPPTPKP